MTKKEELRNALCVILEESQLFTDDEANPRTKYIDSEFGICVALYYYFREYEHSFRVWVYTVSRKSFKTWSGFSGKIAYPVDGYREYASKTNLWIGESGEKRRSLLNHMISELSQ